MELVVSFCSGVERGLVSDTGVKSNEGNDWMSWFNKKSKKHPIFVALLEDLVPLTVCLVPISVISTKALEI